MLEALYLWDVRVPVDDGLTTLEPRGEPFLAPDAWAGVVNHADPEPAHLDDLLLRQGRLQCGLVHVPAHALHRRTERAQFVEERGRHEVPGVQDEIGATQELEAGGRQRPRSAREMRVGDDGDAAQEGKG